MKLNRYLHKILSEDLNLEFKNDYFLIVRCSHIISLDDIFIVHHHERSA